MREWVKDASLLTEAATNDDLNLKRVCLKKIFGSNLFLKNRRIEFTPIKPYASLREARENFEKTNSIQLAAPGTGRCPNLFDDWHRAGKVQRDGGGSVKLAFTV